MSAMTLVAKTFQQNFLFRLYKHYIIDSIHLVKRSGFKELVRQRGVKFFYVVVGYYVVRDTVLYVLLPYFIAQGLF